MPNATPYHFTDDGSIPNNPTLPMLVYPAALNPATADLASAFEDLFAANQWTGGCWRNGIYSFPHYHSTAHEVLGIAAGQAQVRFGGQTGQVLTVKAGDVALLPAGCGHQNLDASPDLLVVGAYPPGPDWDLCRGESGERPHVLDNIAQVPLPATDPVGGTQGPVLEHWHGA
ncbi:MAG: hypothetical protein GKR89_22710 [Candidatus Latescibacteria bacterium]|nr:hypothetical protein [Candidatus Latescibacterota bacterium]